MLKEYANVFRRLTIAADVVVISLSFFLGHFIRNLFDPLFPVNFYIGLLPVIVALWVGFSYSFEMYTSLRTKSTREIVSIILTSAFWTFIALASLLYLFKIKAVSRSLIAVIFALTAVLLCLEKMLILWMIRCMRNKGYNFRNILIVGTGPRAQKFMHLIEQHREWGLKIVGLVDDVPEKVGQRIKGYPVLGMLNNILDIVHTQVVDELVLIVPRGWLSKLEGIIYLCEVEGLKVHVVADFYEPIFSRISLSHLYKFPLITFERSPQNPAHLIFKRLIDIVLSSTALILLSPVFSLVALLIKTTSQGPVFFRQERCGLNGRRFTLYKFRTMVQDAPNRLKELLQHNEMSGPVFKLENDPRVTAPGKYLRKFSLDELPQLWNVLRGDMSLIGPRPPIPAEVHQYDPWHRRRLRMRPGLSCLWQINGRNKITNFDQWAQMDLDYIDRWSLWLDFKILVRTIPAVFMGTGAK